MATTVTCKTLARPATVSNLAQLWVWGTEKQRQRRCNNVKLEVPDVSSYLCYSVAYQLRMASRKVLELIRRFEGQLYFSYEISDLLPLKTKNYSPQRFGAIIQGVCTSSGYLRLSCTLTSSHSSHTQTPPHAHTHTHTLVLACPSSPQPGSSANR